MPATTSAFESAVLQHLDAAHNLARWLTGNDSDAQDVVQESCVKALRAEATFRGGDFRPWFFAIVRNTTFTWLTRSRKSGLLWGDESIEAGAEIAADEQQYDPSILAMRAADAQLVQQALKSLPTMAREVLVLREMEGLSYKEIGKIVGVPLGTVMSRLARGRAQLQALLVKLDLTGDAECER